MAFAEQRPWIERTGWEDTYKDRSREVLSALAVMPLRSIGRRHHLLCQGGFNGLDEDLVSPSDDEKNIVSIISLVDAMMDRCEETSRKTSRNILCWLRSTQPSSCYAKPFTLGRQPASTRKYRLLFKRCLVMILRAYRLNPDLREKLTGIHFHKTQLRCLEKIWSHAALTITDSQDAQLPTFKHNDDMGGLAEAQQCLLDDEDYGEENDEDEEDEEDEEDDGDGEENDEDDENGDGDDYDEENKGWEGDVNDNSAEENAPIKGSLDELLEFLFGLSLALCTEPLTVGQPSSTMLIYYSGVLGFSPSSRAFLSAKSYTPYLSGLIYIQRLLFLELALPLRAYPSLKISCRPRYEQLKRLESIRTRYMVVGSQSPLEEMISLRNYGRVMARSDTSSFLLRWSEDGQTVFHGDSFQISMAEFRLLAEHIINETNRLCTELMYGWEPTIDLAKLKDDMTNTEKGFSFVLHPENHLKEAYLELSKKACTARSDSLSRRGQWNWKEVFKYLKKDGTLRSYFALGMVILCGQGPRWSDLSNVWRVNGEFGERGIYIYNGSMIYLTRHHKAKRSTNREFIVARFLPAELGHLLCKYLAYIARFVDLLERERYPGFREGGASSLLLFGTGTSSGSKSWATSHITSILKDETSKIWGEQKQIISRLLRQLMIGITEQHVREVHQPFNRFDDRSENADRNVVFAWQSNHRPLQRGMTYGLDGAFPTKLQPQLLHLYEWASTKWHEFLHLPSKLAQSQTRNNQHLMSLQPPIQLEADSSTKPLRGSMIHRASEAYKNQQHPSPPQPSRRNPEISRGVFQRAK